MTMTRPLLAAALTAAALAHPGCTRSSSPGGPLRLGYFANVTHAQALVGLDDGSLARGIPGGIEARMFNAGPAAMEALLGGDLDASYVGPGPAVLAYLRSRGEGVRVVAGAASGGAVLVVAGSVRAPRDLLGKRVASPQHGNTQDVALRTWLRAQKLPEGRGPGAVEVTPIANADALALFARGDLAGAWVPEPWGARLVAEAGGHVLVDERTLWPGGRFPTAVLVVSGKALRDRRAELVALVRAHVALTERWRAEREGFAAAANAAYGKRVGKPLPAPVLADAFSRVEPSSDPLLEPLLELARQAQALGFAPPGEVRGLVDGSLLQDLARR
jgi:NitT/TauT family transport system substrate-binding protein